MDEATTKFQETLKYALFSTAPLISAQTHGSGNSSDFCQSCGGDLLDGLSTVRSVRKNGRRLREIQCGTCSYTLQQERQAENVPSYPMSRHQRRRIKQTTPATKPITVRPFPESKLASPLVLPPPIVEPPTKTPIKTQQKKKSTLQGMLERNRKRKDSSPQAPANAGLAMFLSQL
ncbi:hypothetical protein CYLTODRAFT_449271 [Cylindrobasidium torrendii FP15055 ss-10]|uniref:Uncharacterized protein n=1 Tax=Cylindrobasidium torrendii FP15055 ss-10 TaxID=1314674 RepID=A0A0D7BU43_9AGAR|nr:hypothetical protein CYLTODRAFT_449271 [Cylindrobasidium torrendii FP15055 ss-10]